MSSQIIPLKGRTDFGGSSRILATETVRVAQHNEFNHERADEIAPPLRSESNFRQGHPVFPELAGNFSSMSPRGFEAPPSASLNVLPFVT
jgi:hypothetical protein